MTWRVNMYSELTKPPWSKSEWGMKISLRGRYLQKSLAYKSQHSTRTHISSLIIMLGKGKTNERTDPIINSAYLMISNPTPRSSRFTLKNPIHSGYRTYTWKRWSDRRRICISWKKYVGIYGPKLTGEQWRVQRSEYVFWLSTSWYLYIDLWSGLGTGIDCRRVVQSWWSWTISKQFLERILDAECHADHLDLYLRDDDTGHILDTVEIAP